MAGSTNESWGTAVDRDRGTCGEISGFSLLLSRKPRLRSECINNSQCKLCKNVGTALRENFKGDSMNIYEFYEKTFHISCKYGGIQFIGTVI